MDEKDYSSGATLDTLQRDFTEQAEQRIGKGVDTVKETARNVSERVSGAASAVRQKAENLTTAVGGALEDAGHFLREDGIDKITGMVRRNPMPALLSGIGLGFVIALALRWSFSSNE